MDAVLRQDKRILIDKQEYLYTELSPLRVISAFNIEGCLKLILMSSGGISFTVDPSEVHIITDGAEAFVIEDFS